MELIRIPMIVNEVIKSNQRDLNISNFYVLKVSKRWRGASILKVKIKGHTL